MSIPTIELSFEEITAEGIDLTAEDLAFAHFHGLINDSVLVDLAADALGRGSTDPIITSAGILLRDELYRVPDVLAALDDPERIHDPRESARKWLYLVLKTGYQHRSAMIDPLEFVEIVYAEFDYPPRIDKLVRYMPAAPGEKTGADVLMRRWEEYLRQEHTALKRAPSPDSPHGDQSGESI
jgi:hypothetical protein